MKENKPLPFSTTPPPPTPPLPPEQRPCIPAGKPERRLAVGMGVLGVLSMYFLLFGGFYLAFGLAAGAILLAGTGYLLRRGHKLTVYSGIVLLFSLLLLLSLGRSDDGFVKFVTVMLLFLSANLGLCLLAGKNRCSPAGFSSLVDSFRAALVLSFSALEPAFRGLNRARKELPAVSKGTAAVIAGLAIALPLVAIVVVLLVRADAAFAGLWGLLPAVNFREPLVALVFGLPLAAFLYAQVTGLHHAPENTRPIKAFKGLNPVTVNTALGAVCGVYFVYLLSQLAYFAGGFSGILPQDYTLAQYARRGFFEMVLLDGINLTVMALAIALTRGSGRPPLATRILCLFIGIISLFFAVSASAKMLMYIDSFGLTRLRVLTEVIMVFLALATGAMCLWLFLPKLPYMKVILVTTLALGTLVAWADVDTVVAAYNVRSYQAGQLNTVDVWYLSELSDGVVPYLAELTEDADPALAQAARKALHFHSFTRTGDFRQWNYASAKAQKWMPKEEPGISFRDP